MDSNSFEAYNHGYSAAPQYTHSPALSNAGMSPMNSAQIQYQQALMAQAQSQMPRPPGFYGSPGGMPQVTGMPNGMAYGTASSGPQMVDPYRQNSSPMVPPGIGYQQGYNPMMSMGGYGQYGVPQYYQQQGQIPQGQMGGQRRGRVS